MINFYLIRSKEAQHFDESVLSFNRTVNGKYVLNIIDELSSREETLNKIFSLNKNKDLVCFSDDIILTNGWLEIIEKNLHSHRSIGFSMKKPGKDIISNYGYDLVDDEGSIRTQARIDKPLNIKTNQDINSM